MNYNLSKLTERQQDYVKKLSASLKDIPNKQAIRIMDYYVEKTLKLNQRLEKAMSRSELYEEYDWRLRMENPNMDVRFAKEKINSKVNAYFQKFEDDAISIQNRVQQMTKEERAKADERRKELMNQVMKLFIQKIKGKEKTSKDAKETFFNELEELFDRSEYEDLMDYYIDIAE